MCDPKKNSYSYYFFANNEREILPRKHDTVTQCRVNLATVCEVDPELTERIFFAGLEPNHYRIRLLYFL